MIPQAIYQVVQATARQNGVAFSLRDARRTLITGSELQDENNDPTIPSK